MKTSDEFLEELTKWLQDHINYLEGCEGNADGQHDAYKYTLKKIEQFQAEQKQVSDDNLNI